MVLVTLFLGSQTSLGSSCRYLARCKQEQVGASSIREPAGNSFKFTDPTTPCPRTLARALSLRAFSNFPPCSFSAEQLHSMLSSYGRNNLQTAFPDHHPLKSPSATPPNPLTTLLSTHFSPSSLLSPGVTNHIRSAPSPSSNESSFPYHPNSFVSFQNSLKLKKKKQRTTKIGPDGIPLKRKSRDGSTTYLWEFLLKLLQVFILLQIASAFLCMKNNYSQIITINEFMNMNSTLYAGCPKRV